MRRDRKNGKGLLLALALWGLLSCLPGNVLALEPIQNIKVSPDGILSWSAFPGTGNYWVGIDGSSVPTDKLQADLKELLGDLVLEDGDHLVELSAADSDGNMLSETWTRTYHITGGPEGGAEEVVAETEATDLSAATVTIGDATFNGKEKKPRPRVVLDGQTLKNGTDYKAAYSKNRQVGLARVVITGTGAYKGSITVRFQISPRPTSLVKVTGGTKSLSLTWKKQSPQVSGYQIEISMKKDFSEIEKSLEIKGASMVKKYISGLKKQRNYYVRIRTFKSAGQNGYYSSWSKIRYAKTK